MYFASNLLLKRIRDNGKSEKKSFCKPEGLYIKITFGILGAESFALSILINVLTNVLNNFWNIFVLLCLYKLITFVKK